ncbi:hypothetical protein ABIB57_003632 [Devosia sp. UYZn731]|uniref:hypothetical protein n=1 Tax=Devosia sp. UYZn731 TaxID=3156345 RepID=UPI003396AE24
MGFTPQQVNTMSMWQFFSALNGFIAANTPKEGNKLSTSEADELFDWIDRDGGGARVLTTQTYWWEDDDPVPNGLVTFATN